MYEIIIPTNVGTYIINQKELIKPQKLHADKVLVRKYTDEITSRGSSKSAKLLPIFICDILYYQNYKIDLIDLVNDELEVPLVTIIKVKEITHVVITSTQTRLLSFQLSNKGNVPEILYINNKYVRNTANYNTIQGLVELEGKHYFACSINRSIASTTSLLDNNNFSDEIKNKLEYLKQFTKDIRVKCRSSNIDYRIQMIEDAYNAQKLLSKYMNCSIYPKYRALILETKYKSDEGLGGYSASGIIDISYTNEEAFKQTYMHEYGHYIYDYYRYNTAHNLHNAKVLKELVTKIRKLPTIQKIKERSTHRGKLTSYGKYMNDSSEIFARLVESYISRKVGYKREVVENWLFTEVEIACFMEHVTKLKIN